MHEDLRLAAEEARNTAEDARNSASEARLASELAQKASYDQSLIMQELRDTLSRYDQTPDP